VQWKEARAAASCVCVRACVRVCVCVRACVCVCVGLRMVTRHQGGRQRQLPQQEAHPHLWWRRGPPSLFGHAVARIANGDINGHHRSLQRAHRHLAAGRDALVPRHRRRISNVLSSCHTHDRRVSTQTNEKYFRETKVRVCNGRDRPRIGPRQWNVAAAWCSFAPAVVHGAWQCSCQGNARFTRSGLFFFVD